jgi:hypothetical protein
MSNIGSRKGSVGVFSRQSSFSNQDAMGQESHLASDEEMFSPRLASSGMPPTGKYRHSLFR